MAAVAGHVDELVPLGHLLQGRGVPEFDAVVQAGPQPSERMLHEAHEDVRVIGGDLERMGTRAQHDLAARQVLGAQLLRNRRAHGARAQHGVHDGAPVREVRPDAHRATARVQRMEAARHAPAARRGGELGAEQLTQRQRRVELHQRVAPVDEYLQGFAQPTREHPVLRQQQTPPGRLVLWCPAPVDRHRHQAEIGGRVGAQRANHLLQLRRGPAVRPRVPEAARPAEIEVGERPGPGA